MRRVWVVGSTGAGKSTLAAAIAARLAVPHVEVDAIHHLADWRPIELGPFRERIAEIVRTDGWVIDGNYSRVSDLIQARADTIVWLDLPRHAVMRQVIVRTLRRVGRREDLWNDNRERWRNFFTLDPNESVLIWAWTSYARTLDRFTALESQVATGFGIRFHHLYSHAEANAFLATLGRLRSGSDEEFGSLERP